MNKEILLSILIIITMISSQSHAEMTETLPSDEISREQTTISFSGDVSFANSVGYRVKKYGTDYPLAKVKDILSEDDLSIVNLETAVTNEANTENLKKEFNFKSSLNTANALKNASIEIVALANNHTLDFGEKGFIDTLNALRNAGVDYIGGGKNYAEASRLLIKEINGIKYGFLNYSRVVPSISWYARKNSPGIVGAYDGQLPNVLKEVKSANEKADILVVVMHWGKEPNEKVRPEEKKAGRALIDAGADVVIGHHPHLLQGAEFYNGGAIFYSLGNFVFPNMGGEMDKSCILQMKINDFGERRFEFIPIAIVNSRPVPLEGESRLNELKCIDKLMEEFGTTVGEDGILRIKFEN